MNASGTIRSEPANRGGIKLCALVPYPIDTTPSQRFRIEQWAPFLEREGISVDLKPFIGPRLMETLHRPGLFVPKSIQIIDAFFKRTIDAFSVRSYDAILIHRGVSLAGPALLERFMRLLGRPTIFDFDDAIYVLDTSSANKYFGWLKFPGKTASLCRMSNHVVVGSNHLARYARAHNSKVTIVPTSIDTDLYQPVKREQNTDPVVIGWTGSSTSQNHLEQFAHVLREITRRRNVEIRVQSNRKPELPGVPFTWKPWSPETEVKELAEFDIGIKPMPDDPWSRGKCPMKEIQYMAMGLPTICSAVGASREIIRDNENGFLASTDEQWISRLEELIDNPGLREQLGAAGRRTVEEGYSASHCASLFATVVRETIESFAAPRLALAAANESHIKSVRSGSSD